MSSRSARPPLAPPGVGVSEVALGDHRGEPLIVGVDLDAGGAGELPQGLDLVERGPGRRAQLAVERTGQPDHDAGCAPTSVAAATMARWSSSTDPARTRVAVRAGQHAGGIAGGEADAARARGRRRGPAHPRRHRAGGEHRRVEERERVVDRADVLTTALHHVGVLGGTATERLRRVARDLGRRRAARRRDPCSPRPRARPCRPSASSADERDDARAERVACGDRERAQLAGIETVAPHDDDAVGRRRRERRRFGARLLRPFAPASSSCSCLTWSRSLPTRSGELGRRHPQRVGQPAQLHLFVVDARRAHPRR